MNSLLNFLLPLSLLTAVTAQDKLLLSLEFSDPAALGGQSDTALPVGTVMPDAKASLEFPGALDLGGKGYLRIPGFRSPRGPFSVEARFRVNEYAPQSARYISDILNTATWDDGPTQGFAMRIGGGYLYAPRPREAYASDADYGTDIAWYDDTERASVSRCIGEFLMAREDGGRDWKEVVTDRCIQRNAWVHMVGVWDGKDMHIYFDGQKATDSLRILGGAAKPRIDSLSTAFVGARADGDFDSRHLDGTLDFVRVIDRDLDELEVRRRYRDTRPASDTLCHGAILPEYPLSCQAVKGDVRFRFRITAEGACTDPGFRPELGAGDSVDVEIAKDPDFQEVLLKIRVGKLFFNLDAAGLASLGGHAGAVYWRARLVRTPAALAKTAASSVPGGQAWSLSRPFYLAAEPNAGTRTVPRARALAPLMISGRMGSLAIAARDHRPPRIHDLDGRHLPLRFERQGDRWMASMPESYRGGILFLSWE